jgi:hypothetical protein
MHLPAWDLVAALALLALPAQAAPDTCSWLGHNQLNACLEPDLATEYVGLHAVAQVGDADGLRVVASGTLGTGFVGGNVCISALLEPQGGGAYVLLHSGQPPGVHAGSGAPSC